MEVGDRSPYTSLPTAALESATVRPAVQPGQATKAANRAEAAPEGASPADSSTLSPAARIAAAAALLPEVRQDKVDALRQQIESGSYQVGTHDVADALLRNFRG